MRQPRQIKISHQKLKKLAENQGLSLLGTLSLPYSLVKPKRWLIEWQNLGFAGEMAFMQRPSELLVDPLRLLPEANSITLFASYYDRGASPKTLPAGYGRVARYAWGRDYHRVLKRSLSKLVGEVESELGQEVIARVFSDSVPLLERSFAAAVGAGFIGKNTMLIRPKGNGSFFFISEVLWNLVVVESPASAILGSCGSCEKCIKRCPTSAIVSPRKLDARRCISYLTIEKRSILNTWERTAIGEWLFGCDICQEVCPFNSKPLKIGESSNHPKFDAKEGVGPIMDLTKILKLRDNEAFLKVFAGTALMRTKRRGLLRNAAIVAANTKAEQCFPALLESFKSDADPFVRLYSFWALYMLTKAVGKYRQVSCDDLFGFALADSDQIVVEEAKRLEGSD